MAVLMESPVAVEPQVEPPVEPPANLIAALGGPCVVPSPGQVNFEFHRFNSQTADAERAQDWARAAELAKLVVRNACSNEHWWLKLAELQMRAGSPADAVATLSAFDARNGNAVERRLLDAGSPLHALLEQEVYQTSELAQKLAEARKSVDVRRAAAVARLATVSRPEENYVAQGACPFECCMYGEWTATEATTLYREPGSDEAVATIQPVKVDALGGEMRLRPTPVLVRNAVSGYDEEVAEPESIVFLLDYQGEGHGNVWIDREVKTLDWTGVQEHCAAPNRECWGEVLRPEDAGEWRNGVWWIKIRTKDGTTGWTSEADHFTGADACG
jgi:hypothetical protein